MELKRFAFCIISYVIIGRPVEEIVRILEVSLGQVAHNFKRLWF